MTLARGREQACPLRSASPSQQPGGGGVGYLLRGLAKKGLLSQRSPRTMQPRLGFALLE